jgi:hypothetical protein
LGDGIEVLRRFKHHYYTKSGNRRLRRYWHQLNCIDAQTSPPSSHVGFGAIMMLKSGSFFLFCVSQAGKRFRLVAAEFLITKIIKFIIKRNLNRYLHLCRIDLNFYRK